MNKNFALIPAGLVLASGVAMGAAAPEMAAPTTDSVAQTNAVTTTAPTPRSFNWEKYVHRGHHKRHHVKRHHHAKRYHHESKWEKRGREIGRYYEMKYGR